jgi:low temperature requirement protein LtrA
VSELIDRSARVSSLELFFDLVFVFTITQLTGVLVAGDGAESALQVIVMLLVIWWMYDGYAWLTNAIATDLVRFRLLLLGGMGGFLVIALAIPAAYDGQGLAFGVGYAVVVLLHAGMYSKSTSVSEVAAILRIVPYNLTAAGLVLVGGIAGGRAQDVIWLVAAVLLWGTGWFADTEGFVIAAEHFVERHGLVIIIALGESIVVIGAAAAGIPLDLRLVVVAVLALALSAVLWWLYFRDEDAVERAMVRADQARRARFALIGFGYWHFGLLLGVVAVAAGLKKAIGDPYETLDGWIAVELAVGVALFIACDVGFRRVLGITGGSVRLVAAAAALATIPLGLEVAASAQVGALAAIVASALILED